MRWVQHDGGRGDAGYKGEAGDCAVRAVAIALEKPYQKIYDELWGRVRCIAGSTRKKHLMKGGSPRNGVHKEVMRDYMAGLGWQWTPTMKIGSGCQVHMRADELPKGRLVVSLSKHYAAVVDGVLYDTHDCTRAGTRCVYGYWTL